MTVFECPRCDWQFTTKQNLIRHLNCKNICSAKDPDSDVSATEIIQNLGFGRTRKTEYNPLTDYQCSICHALFKTEPSMKRHVKNKHAQPKPTEPPQPQSTPSIPPEVAEELRFLREEVLKLRDRPPVVVNNNNCTFHQQSNVINAFGKENIEYIRNMPTYHTFMKHCILNKADGVCNYLVKKHFHKEHPENHNILRRNKKDEFVHIFDGEDWKPKMAEDALEQLFAKCERDFADFAEAIEGTKGMKRGSLDDFMKEVGLPLEWDISCESYEFDPDMITKDEKTAFKKKLFKLALEYIHQYSKNKEQLR